ncbi:MAG: DUF3515 family protein [Marmoricola sp.]
MLTTLPLLTGLAACGSSSVEVVSFPVTDTGRQDCGAFLRHLPATVAGRQRRPVEGSSYAAAWGDPAIVLRCGLQVLPGKPKTDPCLTRNGIGWTVPPDEIDDDNARIDMTLSHRSLRVSVQVPGSYRPNGPSEVMADLDADVRAHTEARGHCS